MRLMDHEFRLPGKEARESTLKAVDGLLTLESLRKVSLPAMKDLDSIFEDRLSKLDQLEKITILRGGDLSDRGIASLKNLKKLKSISIDQTKIGDPSLEVIGQMKQMTDLYLGGHLFTDEGVKHLANLDELRYLCIDGPPKDVRPTIFAIFMQPKKELVKGDVTDDGLQELLQLKKLTYLSVFQTQCSDSMAAKFKACLLYTSPSPRDLSTSRMPSSA